MSDNNRDVGLCRSPTRIMSLFGNFSETEGIIRSHFKRNTIGKMYFHFLALNSKILEAFCLHSLTRFATQHSCLCWGIVWKYVFVCQTETWKKLIYNSFMAGDKPNSIHMTSSLITWSCFLQWTSYHQLLEFSISRCSGTQKQRQVF